MIKIKFESNNLDDYKIYFEDPSEYSWVTDYGIFPSRNGDYLILESHRRNEGPFGSITLIKIFPNGNIVKDSLIYANSDLRDYLYPVVTDSSEDDPKFNSLDEAYNYVAKYFKDREYKESKEY